MANRKIEFLDECSHVRLRTNMYLGSTQTIERNIIILKHNNLLNKINIGKTKIHYNEAMYRCFVEIMDNSVDETLRCNNEGYHPEKIIVKINSKDNSVCIEDTGKGFIDTQYVDKTFTTLRSGSNFNNDSIDENIIGTNGTGAACVNMVSDYFYVCTSNKTTTYSQQWDFFKTTLKQSDKNKTNKTGTRIEFIPSKEIFKKTKWDFDILFTRLYFKNLEFQLDENLCKTKIEFYWDEKLIDLSVPLFNKNNSLNLKPNKNCDIFVWENKDENANNISFVNGSMCEGNQVNYINSFLNEEIFGDKNANKFYNTFVSIKLKPKFVKFREQVKERLDISKDILEQELPLKITKQKFQELQEEQIYKNIKDAIDDYNDLLNNKKLKKNKNKTKNIVASNYFTSRNNKNIFVCEGLSALGSIVQCRNTNDDSLYAIKGKIMNADTEKDILENKVLSELVSILELNFEDGGKSCKFEKVIISSDADEDGNNICFQFIDFFYRFFPKLIEQGKIYRLKVPLISYKENNKIKYLYSLNDFDETGKENIRYLKGLGSCSLTDWQNIFKNMMLEQFVSDNNTTKMLRLFSDKSQIKKRKKYLTMV